MDDKQSSENSENDNSSKMIGRRGFIVTLGFGVAASALLRKLPGKSSEGIPKASSEKISLASTTTSTSLPDVSTSLNNEELSNEIETVFETVISGGRVIDPDSGFDGIANIGINGDSIRLVSNSPLTGNSEIDATGLVVAPGFIDVLSYPTNGYGEWFKIADGVTSNLCMHGIDNPMEQFLENTKAHNPPVNYGGAVDHYQHRKILGIESKELLKKKEELYLNVQKQTCKQEQ